MKIIVLTEVEVNGVRFVRADAPPEPKRKSEGERVAEEMVRKVNDTCENIAYGHSVADQIAAKIREATND